MWLKVSQCAGRWGCHRTTAYDRLRRLEEETGKAVLVARSLHGRRKVLMVREADFERAARSLGITLDNAQLTEIKELVQEVADGQELLAQVLARIASRVGAA